MAGVYKQKSGIGKL